MVAPLAGFPNAGVLTGLQYDRTMESQDPGVVGGLRSGETGPGGGSSGVRCLPWSPHSLHPASALSGYGPPGRGLEVNAGPRVGAPTFRTFQWERAALKVDCPNSSGGGKRGSSPNRKSSKKPSIEEEEDGDSRSSESPANCFGFVAYSVNSGERPRVKSHQHTCSYTPSERSRSPTPSPSPRKLRRPARYRVGGEARTQL